MGHQQISAREACFLRARAELGTSANSAEVLSRAITNDPAVFDAGSSSPSKITAAMASAAMELGEGKPFTVVWSRAAEIDPSAFN